ncbi:MAG TPA: topoisomerase C-terminal repeat-containing protein, partial [Bacteroidales bacterium]|nr:topoisomerase C-terminal repeat-containing protein [Bacteroidales bacterium]
EYVEKGEREGVIRQYDHILLKGGKIKETVLKEKTGYEKGKLFPTDIGELVTRFLMQYFDDVMDYNFTASVEKEFDEIAQGLKAWNKMIRDFYGPFHSKVEQTLEVSERVKGERLLGTDPKTGKNVYVKLAKFGPVAQIGETDSPEKPRFAGMRKGQTLESITLEEALKLFDFPRLIGQFEGHDMTVGIGRFGPYVLHNKVFVSLKKTDDPAAVTAERCIELIEEKRNAAISNTIREFSERPDVKVLKGRFGPYISIGKENYRIPKGKAPESLTLEDCLKIAEATPATTKKKTANRGKK